MFFDECISLELLPKELNLIRQWDISRINLIKQYAISVGAQLSWMKAEISLPSKVACYKFSARRNFAVFGRRIIISVNGRAYNSVQCVTRSEMCHGHSSKPSRWKRESNMITVFTAISRTVRNYFVYISRNFDSRLSQLTRCLKIDKPWDSDLHEYCDIYLSILFAGLC